MTSIKNQRPNEKGRYKQGYYKLVNPNKYASLDKRIIYRSGLELQFFTYFDTNNDIISWSSENLIIKYMHPMKGKIMNYNIDVMFTTRTGKKYIGEIKPYAFLTKPIKPSNNATDKKKEAYKYALERYVEILYKKEAAQLYAKRHGMDFVFLTERYFVKVGK